MTFPVGLWLILLIFLLVVPSPWDSDVRLQLAVAATVYVAGYGLVTLRRLRQRTGGEETSKMPVPDVPPLPRRDDPRELAERRSFRLEVFCTQSAEEASRVEEVRESLRAFGPALTPVVSDADARIRLAMDQLLVAPSVEVLAQLEGLVRDRMRVASASSPEARRAAPPSVAARRLPAFASSRLDSLSP
ncbi:MAG TPA: hypothetical protein VGJ96_12740 [Gemmatimonadaceae bacterium]